MIKLIDILKEAKQVGPLYHFTNILFLNNILKTGLKFNPDNSGLSQYKNTFYISATRQQNGTGTIKDIPEKTFNVRIKLDGNKISERYKVEPINVINVWMAGGYGNPSIKYPELFEERIISNKPGYLSPSYIFQIDTIVPEEDLDDKFIGKINIVNKF